MADNNKKKPSNQSGESKKAIYKTTVSSFPTPVFNRNQWARFVLDGRPVAMQRPRTARGGSHVYSPTSAKVAIAHSAITECMQQSNAWSHTAGVTIFAAGVPVKVEVDFYISKYMGRTSDLDNLLKFALDVLNKSILHDDEQVEEICGKEEDHQGQKGSANCGISYS
jgi:Holliday junction resolvase RusA-like endonuclease